MPQHAHTARLRTALGRLGRRGAHPAPQILVTSPRLRLESGDLDRPFHIASIDKMMTATLVARLVEEGRLRFDSPLGGLLPRSVTDGLPAAPGFDIARDVTVEHLLTHTSGLPDILLPPRGQTSEASLRRVVATPDRGWTRDELLAAAHTMTAVGRPGERFHYSDTAYLLLGRVAEEVGGDTYATLLQRYVFTPAGMARTCAPFDDACDQERLDRLDIAPLWIRGSELSRRMALTLGWGGVVATAADLVRFQQALHGGRLVSPEHVAHLTRRRHRMRPGIHYGAGAVTIRFGEFMPGALRGLPEPVGGLGLTAAHLFFSPQQQAHVVLNLHSTRAMGASFRTHIAIARLLATN